MNCKFIFKRYSEYSEEDWEADKDLMAAMGIASFIMVFPATFISPLLSWVPMLMATCFAIRYFLIIPMRYNQRSKK